MESILLFIIDHPGTQLTSLYSHYRCVLQPVAIDDCIEFFQQMSCLETVRVSSKAFDEKGIDLYSTEQLDDEEETEEIAFDHDNDLERLLAKSNFDYRQSTLYCFPTYDCLTKFGLAFPASLTSQARTFDRMPFPSY